MMTYQTHNHYIPKLVALPFLWHYSWKIVFAFKTQELQATFWLKNNFQKFNSRLSAKEIGWFVLTLGQRFLYLYDAVSTTMEELSLFKLICSKNDGLIHLMVLSVG